MFLPAQGPTGGERRTVLAARGVSHVYGSGATAVRALDDVSLTLERGEMVALSGPSGSGKSTFMSLVCGLEQLQHGEVDVCGTSLGTLTDAQLHTLRRGSVGMIFQGYNLLASLTAAENVALPLELSGTPARAAAATAEEWLGDVGLDGLGDRYPDQLSGGQQQRVAIARALVTGAQLVLADEPTGALDSTSGALVISTLRDQARRRGAAVLVVTHDATVAAACDRHLQLRDGRLQDPLATPATSAS